MQHFLPDYDVALFYLQVYSGGIGSYGLLAMLIAHLQVK